MEPPTLPSNFEAALSYERFARYAEWADGDRSRAIELYTLNTKLSEALYIPLQTLEIALRNRIHTVLAAAFEDRWFDRENFLSIENQRRQLAKAIEELAHDRKEQTPGRVVAALTFSFWTSMLSPDYETLWQTTLNRIARREDGKGLRRKDLSKPLTPIRTLRNRVAHHEPIIQWNLPKHYHNIVQITRWLSPAAADWCVEHNRFLIVHPANRITLATS